MTDIAGETLTPGSNGQEFHGAIIFDRQGEGDKVFGSLPDYLQSGNLAAVDTDSEPAEGETISSFEAWNRDEIETNVDLVVEAMANLYDQSSRLSRRELRKLTRFTANSVTAVAEQLARQSMKFRVTIKNRDYKISDGRPHERPVDLGAINHDKARRQLTVGGDYLFREVCKAVYHNDEVKVIEPGRVDGGTMNELVYKTRFEEVDFKMTQFSHLSVREKAERGIPASRGRQIGRQAVYQATQDSTDAAPALAI